MRFTIPISLLVLAASCGPSEQRRLHYEPAQSPLTQAYGISPEESARELNQQEYIGELNERLHNGALPYFSDLWIQHEPTYAIKVAFTRPPEPAALLALAHRSLRQDIVIVPAKRTFAEIRRDQDRIDQALRGAPGAWAGGYTPVTQKFEYTFASEAALEYARSHIPAGILPDVDLKIGPTPVPL